MMPIILMYRSRDICACVLIYICRWCDIWERILIYTYVNAFSYVHMCVRSHIYIQILWHMWMRLIYKSRHICECVSIHKSRDISLFYRALLQKRHMWMRFHTYIPHHIRGCFSYTYVSSSYIWMILVPYADWTHRHISTRSWMNFIYTYALRHLDECVYVSYTYLVAYLHDFHIYIHISSHM